MSAASSSPPNISVTFEHTSCRVKRVSFHPTEPLLLACLHSGVVQLLHFSNDDNNNNNNNEHDHSESNSSSALICEYREHVGPVRGGDFHQTHPIFVTGGDDFKIKVWSIELKQRSLFSLVGHLDYIRSTEFHREQPWIVSASDDSTVRIWNWQHPSSLAVLTGHNHYVMSATFHPSSSSSSSQHSNLIVSASLDLTVRVWDVSKLAAKENEKEKKNKKAKKKSTSWAPNEEEPAGGGGGWKSILGGVFDGLFDSLYEQVCVIEGHERGINDAVFFLPPSSHRHQKRKEKNTTSNDQDRDHDDDAGYFFVASASDDRTIRVWKVTPPSGVSGSSSSWSHLQVAVFKGHQNNVSSLVVDDVDNRGSHSSSSSSSSFTIISNSEDRTMRVWGFDPMFRVPAAGDGDGKTADDAAPEGQQSRELQTLRLINDRFWTICKSQHHRHRRHRLFAAGHDAGCMVFRLDGRSAAAATEAAQDDDDDGPSSFVDVDALKRDQHQQQTVPLHKKLLLLKNRKTPGGGQEASDDCDDVVQQQQEREKIMRLCHIELPSSVQHVRTILNTSIICPAPPSSSSTSTSVSLSTGRNSSCVEVEILEEEEPDYGRRNITHFDDNTHYAALYLYLSTLMLLSALLFRYVLPLVIPIHNGQLVTNGGSNNNVSWASITASAVGIVFLIALQVTTSVMGQAMELLKRPHLEIARRLVIQTVIYACYMFMVCDFVVGRLAAGSLRAEQRQRQQHSNNNNNYNNNADAFVFTLIAAHLTVAFMFSVTSFGCGIISRFFAPSCPFQLHLLFALLASINVPLILAALAAPTQQFIHSGFNTWFSIGLSWFFLAIHFFVMCVSEKEVQDYFVSLFQQPRRIFMLRGLSSSSLALYSAAYISNHFYMFLFEYVYKLFLRVVCIKLCALCCKRHMKADASCFACCSPCCCGACDDEYEHLTGTTSMVVGETNNNNNNQEEGNQSTTTATNSSSSVINMMTTKKKQKDLASFNIVPLSITDVEFVKMWNEYEWENIISWSLTSSPTTDGGATTSSDYDAHRVVGQVADAINVCGVNIAGGEEVDYEVVEGTMTTTTEGGDEKKNMSSAPAGKTLRQLRLEGIHSVSRVGAYYLDKHYYPPTRILMNVRVDRANKCTVHIRARQHEVALVVGDFLKKRFSSS